MCAAAMGGVLVGRDHEAHEKHGGFAPTPVPRRLRGRLGARPAGRAIPLRRLGELLGACAERMPLVAANALDGGEPDALVDGRRIWYLRSLSFVEPASVAHEHGLQLFRELMASLHDLVQHGHLREPARGSTAALAVPASTCSCTAMRSSSNSGAPSAVRSLSTSEPWPTSRR